MSSLVLSVAGAAVGFAIGGPAGAKWGWMAGSLLGAATATQPTTTVEGSRLSDLRVQSSAQGQGINKVYGTIRCAGNMIWSLPIRETRTETTTSAGGGKGGGPKTANVSYTYDQTFAIGICEGPIAGVRRIWVNGELVYNVANTANVTTLNTSDTFAKNFTLYLGSESQGADASIQADKGVAGTPAYRGLAYIVFNGLQLADYGNRTPNCEFEVVTSGTVTEVDVMSGWTLVQSILPSGNELAMSESALWKNGNEMYLMQNQGALWKKVGEQFVYVRDLEPSVQFPGGVTNAGDCSPFAHDGWNYVWGSYRVSPEIIQIVWYKFNESETVRVSPLGGDWLDNFFTGQAIGSYYSYKGKVIRHGGNQSLTLFRDYGQVFCDYTTDFVTWTPTEDLAVGTGMAYCEHKGYLYAFAQGLLDTSVQRTFDGINWTVLNVQICSPVGLSWVLDSYYGCAPWSDGVNLYVWLCAEVYYSEDDGLTWRALRHSKRLFYQGGPGTLVVDGDFVYFATVDNDEDIMSVHIYRHALNFRGNHA